MAEQIKNENLPLNKTLIGLLQDKKNRKNLLAQFINDLAVKYPTLKARVEQF